MGAAVVLDGERPDGWMLGECWKMSRVGCCQVGQANSEPTAANLAVLLAVPVWVGALLIGQIADACDPSNEIGGGACVDWGNLCDGLKPKSYVAR